MQSKRELTERDRFWLDHEKAIAKSNGSGAKRSRRARRLPPGCPGEERKRRRTAPDAAWGGRGQAAHRFANPEGFPHSQPGR